MAMLPILTWVINVEASISRRSVKQWIAQTSNAIRQIYRFLGVAYQLPSDFHIWISHMQFTWWRHQMETCSALLAICAGNSPATGEFPARRPVTRSFDVFFDLLLNKRLSKQSWGWWFETLSLPLWRHCYVAGCGATRHIWMQLKG